MVKTLATHAAAALLAAVSTWTILDTRHELQLSRERAAVTGERLGEATNMLNRYNTFAQDVNKNAQAADKLQIALRGLRTDVDSMRTDIGSRITAAGRDALAEYAATCHAVLNAVARGGEQLSITGAAIAAKADGHAADARLIGR